MEQLGEIDKGLRSSNFGDQCEAIASFEKFARDNFKNAVIINAAFLKLAEFFRIRWLDDCFTKQLLVKILQDFGFLKYF